MDTCRTEPLDLQSLINNSETLIVDVRTQSEFSRGNVNGSINIPLHELEDRVEELKTDKTVVMCCASGCRSGQAVAFLQAEGIEAYNGGGWSMVAAQKL